MITTTEVGSPHFMSTYYERQQRDRYKTPKSLRNRGVFLDLPYSLDSLARTQTVSPMWVRGQYPTWEVNPITIEAIGMTPQINSFAVRPTEAEVIAKLADKWRNTDLNIGMYLSPEGRESIAMMGSSLVRIANSARQLKKGDFGGALRSLNHVPRSDRKEAFRKFEQGDLSGSFLAAHLGWEPLLKDVFINSDIPPIVERGQRIKATKRGKRAEYFVGGWNAKHTFSFKELSSLTYDGYVKRPPTFVERFGLGNPFEIAWELVPLSFVADYFLPIGDVIKSMYFISQARFDGLWRKEYDYHSSKVEVPPQAVVMYTQWRDPVWNTQPLHWNRLSRSYTRRPHVLSFSDPLRSMKVELPSSLMKLATLSALTHQRILSLR